MCLSPRLCVPFTAISGSLCSPWLWLGLVYYSNQLEHSAARLSITQGCLRETRRVHRTFQQFILVFAYGDIIVYRLVWKPKGISTQPLFTVRSVCVGPHFLSRSKGRSRSKRVDFDQSVDRNPIDRTLLTFAAHAVRKVGVQEVVN